MSKQDGIREFNVNMISSSQKRELQETGTFTTSKGTQRNAAGLTVLPNEQLKSPSPQPPTADIPVAAIDAQTQPITLPEVTPPQVDVAGAQAAAGSVLDAAQADARAKEAAAANALSESDRRIRETMGILGTESETRAQLEEQGGVNQFTQDVTQFTQRLRNQLAELDQFDLDNVNTLEQMRVDASKRDLTKRTYNAMSAEANIQNSVRRAGMVAQTRATIASVEVAQGNLKQATEQVDKALNAIYDPIRQGLALEMMFNERNYDQFTQAQKNSSDMKMAGIERQLADIDRAVNLSDSAVASGYATADDIQELVNLSSNPQAQAAFAVQILGKGARATVQLENAIKGRQYELLGLEILSENKKMADAAKAAEEGILTPEQFTIANDLRKEVNNMQEVKDAKDLEVNTASLLSALEQENGVGDISAINSFQRLVVDPGVAVREGDVALLQSAMSFTDEAQLRAQGLIKGDKLTPEAREQMKDLVGEVYRIRVELVDRNTSQVRTIANEQGIDYGKYIGNTFKTFEQLQVSATNVPGVTFGLPQQTDEYLNNVTNTILSNPQSNPFGVNL